MHDLPSDACLSFHHVGLASRTPERTVSFLRAIGYATGPRVHDPLQGVEVALATHPSMPAIEMVVPIQERGPLASILRRDAEMMYHVCFETPDRNAALEAMRRAGSRVVLVVPPTPAVLFGGLTVSFHRVGGFGLIELLTPTEVV